ncbi:MAG: FAD:protein FMN transferase [Paracoccaceae bacterium]
MPDPIQFSRRSFMLMPLALAACKFGPDVFRLSGQTMGTTYNVVATGDSVSEGEVQSAIDAALARVNAQMSNWDAGSEISTFNARLDTDSVTMSPELAEVMQAAEAVHQASEGTFDTTMGPLIELWGFGAPGKREMPDDAAIAAALQRSGHGNTLQVGATGLQKRQGEAQVYLAAIGKGYGADLVGRALEDLGITDYMVEIGGDLYASGRNPDGQPWQIGIESPNAHDRGMLDVIGVSGAGLASSGDYRNYFERDGKRYSHVIDPRTGRPVTHHTASATVLADNAMLADAWATAMLILGSERGLEVADAQGIAVMFVDRDGGAGQTGFTTAQSTLFASKTTKPIASRGIT